MSASVILPLQDRPQQALRALQALASLPTDPAFDVIVVDNASAGLESLLARLDGDVTIVRSDRRLGFGAAAALGARRAAGDIVVFLRDAPEVGGDWLAPLVAALADSGVGAAASATAGMPETHAVMTSALAVRRADLEAVGGFPAAPEGSETAALLVALAERGGRIVVVPDSVVSAPGARTGGARRHPGEDIELTVVIPTLDAASDRVRACVAAVHSATDVPYEIVLVDNGAPPQGFTAPVNAGLRAARGRYAVVMNDDVETLPGWWPPLRAALDAGAAVAFPLTVDGAMRTDFAAWCFAIGREDIDRHGHAPGEFFDPSFRVWFQDTDLLQRLRLAGNPPQFVPESQIRHGLSVTVASEDPELRAWIEREIAGDCARFEAKHGAGVAGAART